MGWVQLLAVVDVGVEVERVEEILTRNSTVFSGSAGAVDLTVDVRRRRVSSSCLVVVACWERGRELWAEITHRSATDSLAVSIPAGAFHTNKY